MDGSKGVFLYCGGSWLQGKRECRHPGACSLVWNWFPHCFPCRLWSLFCFYLHKVSILRSRWFFLLRKYRWHLFFLRCFSVGLSSKQPFLPDKDCVFSTVRRTRCLPAAFYLCFPKIGWMICRGHRESPSLPIRNWLVYYSHLHTRYNHHRVRQEVVCLWSWDDGRCIAVVGCLCWDWPLPNRLLFPVFPCRVHPDWI